MAKNDFLPFGIAEGANVLSTPEYESLAARHNGFTSGVAKSKELNKVWRQSSVFTAALAQFIVDTDGKDLQDDGDLPAVKNRLVSALKEAFKGEMPAVPKTVQTTGDSTKDVMSQKAVTDAIKGIKVPEVKDATTTEKGIVQLDATLSDSATKTPPSKVVKAAIESAIKEIPDPTPVGMFSHFPHRAAQLPSKWYSTNGDRFSITSPQGKVLKAMSAEFKSDWKITESGGMINVPNLKQSDGRFPFLRGVNGTSRQVGTVVGDQMRNITGGAYFRQRLTSGAGDSSILWDMSGGKEALTSRELTTEAGALASAGGAGLQKTNTLELNAANQVPTGPEFKPLDIGVTLAIYLGV